VRRGPQHLFDDDGDEDTAEVSRRGSMFRLVADTTHTIGNIDLALSQHMLRLPTVVEDRADGERAGRVVRRRAGRVFRERAPPTPRAAFPAATSAHRA
jgi:hypothetical protein